MRDGKRHCTDMEMEPPWEAAFALAWEAFGNGSTPVGSVVVDTAGAIVARGRGRRLGSRGVPGQLSGSRIAHAEVNALARLPTSGSYGGHTLYSTLESCCLCMGAAIQTGIGRVVFAFEDNYAGAAHGMVVRNPQTARRATVVEQSVRGVPGRLSALLLLVHQRAQRPPLPHVTEPRERAEPLVAEMASGPMGDLTVEASRQGLGLEDLRHRLASVAPDLVRPRP